jgi:ferredoxin--NADP+ reductase
MIVRRDRHAAPCGTAAAVLALVSLLTMFQIGHAFVVVVEVPRLHGAHGRRILPKENDDNDRRTRPSPLLLAAAAPAPVEKDWVKKAGGGIAVQPAGNRLLFDPAQEGKLGGTTNLNDRISQGFQYLPLRSPPASTTTKAPSDVSLEGAELQDAQHWLEDIGVPLNFAKPTSPATATVLGRIKLIDDDAPGDIEHVVLRLPTNMHYVEGQSLSVIPPGVDPASGKPHKPRLYSIASTRYGDLLDGSTVSLCVRRAVFVDPATGAEDPAKSGVCSNYLCDVQPGDTVKVAGPVGKTMLLPHDPNTDIIMVATGTGIAPFRAFLHRLFMENTVARHMFNGRAWLVLGVPVTGGLLYPEELDVMRHNSDGRLEVTYAISREMKNAKGGKLYVQHVLQQRADELFERLDNGAVIYFCGLKGMMPGILEALEQVATERGINWPQRLSQLKANEQWHVEVY